MQRVEQSQFESVDLNIQERTNKKKTKEAKESSFSESFLNLIQGSIKLNQTNSIIASFKGLQKNSENEIPVAPKEHKTHKTNEERSDNTPELSSPAKQNVQDEAPQSVSAQEPKAMIQEKSSSSSSEETMRTHENLKEKPRPETGYKESLKSEIDRKEINLTPNEKSRVLDVLSSKKEEILKESETPAKSDFVSKAGEDDNGGDDNKEIKNVMLKLFGDKRSKEGHDLHVKGSQIEHRVDQIRENKKMARKAVTSKNFNEASESGLSSEKKDGMISGIPRNAQNVYFSNISRNVGQNGLQNEMASLKENLSVKMNSELLDNTQNRPNIRNARFQRLIENPIFKTEMNEQFQKMLNKAKILIKDQKNASLMVNLHPKELGQVSLKLALFDGALNGYFTVDNDTVQKLLLERMEKILTELKEDGYKVSRFQVDVRSNDTSQESPGNSRSQHSSFSQKTNLSNDLQEATSSAGGGIYA